MNIRNVILTKHKSLILKKTVKCQNTIKITIMVRIGLTEETCKASHLFLFLVSISLDLTQAYRK